MRSVAKRQLRQISDMRRIELRNFVETYIENFSVTQASKLILLQRRDSIAVEINDLHFLQVLKHVDAELGDIAICDDELFEFYRQLTVVEFVGVERFNLMLTDLQYL